MAAPQCRAPARLERHIHDVGHLDGADDNRTGKSDSKHHVNDEVFAIAASFSAP
jgi:hypothetical protein